MRIRFFAIILTVLLVITMATLLLHSKFLRQERLALIDQQARETASALIDSELGDLRRIDFAKADKIISAELGENRIGKFFIIRNQAGNILFRSPGTRLLALKDFPRTPQWITWRARGQFVRLLNLNLPGVPDRTLQVGMVINEDLVSPRYLSPKSSLFFLVIVALGLLVAWFLTSTLMKPIRRLETFVSETAPQALSSGELPPVPASLKAQGGGNPDDEYSRLLTGLDSMIDRVNRSHRLSRFWAYQMAHELKTPLAILEVELERNVESGKIAPGAAEAVRKETSRVAETVNSFLSWAELENAGRQRRLHAIRLGKLAAEVRERLAARVGPRLDLSIEKDIRVFANPMHLEQAILNLATNALAYSAPDKRVEIKVDSRSLTVTDSGPGIPPAVLDRLGEPFNHGEQSPSEPRGHGLGLAWVTSLSRLYGWKLDIESDSSGTRASLRFPEIPDLGDDTTSEPAS